MGTNMTIIVVEDDLGLSELITEIIEELGFSSVIHFCAKDAINWLKYNTASLIILDYHLPDMNGKDFIKELNNSEIKYPPFIVSTGQGDERIAVNMMQLGAMDYVIKDSNFLDLLPEAIKKVKRHIDNEQKRVEAENALQQKIIELAEINASKDKFFSIIAHDLKTPFSGFLGLTKIMSENINELSLVELQEFSSSLMESANNLYKLLENLLEWSRIQRGKTSFNPENCSINFLVDQNIAIAKDFAKNKNVSIVSKINHEINVHIDVPMINTVLRNLISNAIKFTNINGIVEIGNIDSYSKEFDCFYIKDSGIGMPNKILVNLFQVDKKVSRKGTQGESSTGLGLLLCKEFIEKHNSKIWVESEEEKGSTFYFTIPKVI